MAAFNNTITDERGQALQIHHAPEGRPAERMGERQADSTEASRSEQTISSCLICDVYLTFPTMHLVFNPSAKQVYLEIKFSLFDGWLQNDILKIVAALSEGKCIFL